jgi:non-ribosomal peptide synthetase component F
MAIEMVGGVYCPLSPRDPQHRLHTLIQQTHSRLVLVHYFTKPMFNEDIVTLDINSMINVDNVFSNVNLTQLYDVEMTPDNIAYIIFTSGSTGTPKAVS